MEEERIGVDHHVSAAHMVLGYDLNPHDTLFAGKAALYMIECGFLAIHDFLQTNHIVFLRMDGLQFSRPVHKGEMINVESTIIHAGKTSVGAYIRLTTFPGRELAAECFLSFVHIIEGTGKAVPHHVVLGDLDEAGQALQQRYLAFKACH